MENTSYKIYSLLNSERSNNLNSIMEKTELEKKYPYIDFGEEFNNSKQQLNAFKEATTRLKSSVSDSDDFVSEYFINLRNEIDLERELSMQQIDDHYELLIKQIKFIEKQCKSDQKFEKMISKFDKDLKRLTDEINIPKFDMLKWKDIKSESMSKVSDINLIIENYHHNLLRNQSLSIGSIKTELGKLLDGDIIEKKEIPEVKEEFPMCTYFQFELLNFDTILNQNSTLLSESYWFKGTKWSLGFENKDDHLVWYLHLDNYENFEYVTTSIELKIISSKKNSDAISKSEQKFEKIQDRSNFKCNSLMKLKDIYEKGFYDQENNCIRCVVKIKINDFQKKEY